MTDNSTHQLELTIEHLEDVTIDVNGTPTVVPNTIVDTLDEVTGLEPVVTSSVLDGANGLIALLIDDTVTANLPTGVNDDRFSGKEIQSDITPFATEYNHFYHIDLVAVNEGTKTRLVRGKCCIRK